MSFIINRFKVDFQILMVVWVKFKGILDVLTESGSPAIFLFLLLVKQNLFFILVTDYANITMSSI